MALGEGSYPAAVGLAYLPGRIGEQGEGQALTAAELCMGIGVIGTDAYYRCTSCPEGGEITLKTPGLQRAAACEIPWIEVEHKPAAAEVGQLDPGFNAPAAGPRCDADETEVGGRLVALGRMPPMASARRAKESRVKPPADMGASRASA